MFNWILNNLYVESTCVLTKILQLINPFLSIILFYLIIL